MKPLKQLITIGTSAGGARPKAVIAYNDKTKEVRSGQTKVPKDFEHWLIKLDGCLSYCPKFSLRNFEVRGRKIVDFVVLAFR